MNLNAATQAAQLSTAPMMDWMSCLVNSMAKLASCAMCVQHEIVFWRVLARVWRLRGFGQADARLFKPNSFSSHVPFLNLCLFPLAQRSFST